MSTNFKAGGGSVSATLRAFERAGVSRVLAEPTLTAISGETAKFTAGGEIPLPKSQDCSTDLFGRRSCQIGVEYKPFGVTLTFTPLVLSENRISMRVNTEVTELDYENTDPHRSSRACRRSACASPRRPSSCRPAPS